MQVAFGHNSGSTGASAACTATVKTTSVALDHMVLLGTDGMSLYTIVLSFLRWTTCVALQTVGTIMRIARVWRRHLQSM